MRYLIWLAVAGLIFVGKTFYYDQRNSNDIYKYCMEWADSNKTMCEALQQEFDDGNFTVDDWNNETEAAQAAIIRSMVKGM